MSSVTVRQLSSTDTDLESLIQDLNGDGWDDFDQPFTLASLTSFLQDDSHVYLVAHIDDQLAGALHAYVMPHPSGRIHFYIDEVDTKKPFRKQGVAKTMMREALRVAGDWGCDEAWLGTEHDNEPAKALYNSLKPDEIENGPIFSWKTK